VILRVLEVTPHLVRGSVPVLTYFGGYKRTSKHSYLLKWNSQKIYAQEEARRGTPWAS